MFWLLFEHASNPVALLDENRRFVDVNDAALAVLGQTRGAVIGRFSTDLRKADERMEAAERWRALVEPGAGSGRRTFVRADGSEVELLCAVRSRRPAARPSSAGPLGSRRALPRPAPRARR
jgi:PAS domain S-box-containing protein